MFYFELLWQNKTSSSSPYSKRHPKLGDGVLWDVHTLRLTFNPNVTVFCNRWKVLELHF